MKRKFRLPVLIGLGLGCALLLWARRQPLRDVSSVVTNTKPVNVSLAPTPRHISPRQLTHWGVLYSLPFGEGKPPSMCIFEIDSGRGYLNRTAHVLHNYNGGLYLLGKGYGKVE